MSNTITPTQSAGVTITIPGELVEMLQGATWECWGSDCGSVQDSKGYDAVNVSLVAGRDEKELDEGDVLAEVEHSADVLLCATQLLVAQAVDAVHGRPTDWVRKEAADAKAYWEGKR